MLASTQVTLTPDAAAAADTTTTTTTTARTKYVQRNAINKLKKEKLQQSQIAW
jgi:hypothetical protein